MTTSWIYGFYRDGKAVYIGQTVNPKTREAFLRTATRSLHRADLADCQFRLIRKTPHSQAARIESQVIRAYKRRGEAVCNIQTKSAPSCAGYGFPVVWLETGRVFGSFNQAARTLGLSAYDLRDAARRAAGKPFKTGGGTFQEAR